MSEVKHTPGPWKVHKGEINIGPYNKGLMIGPGLRAVAHALGEFDETACRDVSFFVARCIYQVTEQSLRKQQPDYEPRQMAVVVAENIGIPRKVVCEYFNVADSIITKWQMEFSVKCANDPKFHSKFQWISGSCRTNTGRRIA